MKNNTKDSKQMLFEMMQKINPDFKIIREEIEEPDNIKYAPSKCQNIDDIKKGLKDLHNKFPNRKSNMIVDVKIKAYEVAAKKLGITFDVYKYFDSL